MPTASTSPIDASKTVAGRLMTTSLLPFDMFEILTGATMPFGKLMAPLGDLLTNEKNKVASLVVLVMRTLIDDGPTTEIGSFSGALSKNPLCPGKNAGLNPARFDSNCEARAPAEPIPGSAEIALGTPPIG